jgi:hypothetical protein
MISLATYRKGLLIRLIIAIVGLGSILLSSLLPEKLIGLPLQEITRELATFVLASLLVHWIYESHLKQEIFQDVADYVLGTGNVSRSGIVDYQENTKDIDYTTVFASPGGVIIGVHYSPRIIEDNSHLLIDRAKAGKQTTIIASSPDGAAIEFLKRVRGEHDHVNGNIKKIASIVKEINKQTPAAKILLLYHDDILRYSFVLSEDRIWVKFYRNSRGLSSVPGFAVAKGTHLYEFFRSDIDRLKVAAMNTADKRVSNEHT